MSGVTWRPADSMRRLQASCRSIEEVRNATWCTPAPGRPRARSRGTSPLRPARERCSRPLGGPCPGRRAAPPLHRPAGARPQAAPARHHRWRPGLVSAFEQLFFESLRQKCAVHGARNVLEKVSKADQEGVKRTTGPFLTTSRPRPGRRQSRSPSRERTSLPRSQRVSAGGRLPAHQPKCAHRPPPLSGRAPRARPPHQPPEAQFRGEPAPGEGDRSVARRALLPIADLRCGIGPASAGGESKPRSPASAGSKISVASCWLSCATG